MRKLGWIFVVCALLMCVSFACADEAADITRQCTITVNGKKPSEGKMLIDQKYNTTLHLKRGAALEISCGGTAMSGVFVRFFDEPLALTAEVQVNGEWQAAAVVGQYLTEWIELPGATEQVRLVNTSGQEIALAEVNVYGPGQRPADVHVWRSIDKADMLLLVAHPDDELLWFAGLLPTYAGERRLNVQVAYAVPTNGQRRLELLDGLWTCGVDAYPAFLGFRDIRDKDLQVILRRWNANRLYNTVTDLIRTYRPEVMVTHAFNGEYGHGAHRAMADAATKCVPYAADPGYRTDAQLPPWQVKKLYVHHYSENKLKMDWEVPLPAFGGETSLSVATRALACHGSQTTGKGGWTMSAGTKDFTDYTDFGLYATTVGPDVMGGDFMEHIIPGAAAD